MCVCHMFNKVLTYLLSIKTRNKMKCTATKKNNNQPRKVTWRKLSLLVFQQNVISERFVAVSTITECQTYFCFKLPRQLTNVQNTTAFQSKAVYPKTGCTDTLACSCDPGLNLDLLVNLRRARLVLRWATVSGFNSRCRTFLSVCNQPATQGQLSLPSLRVGKSVPASAGKAKAGMVHSVSG